MDKFELLEKLKEINKNTSSKSKYIESKLSKIIRGIENNIDEWNVENICDTIRINNNPFYVTKMMEKSPYVDMNNVSDKKLYEVVKEVEKEEEEELNEALKYCE